MSYGANINPVLEGRKKMQDLFIKFEQVLAENDKIITEVLNRSNDLKETE